MSLQNPKGINKSEHRLESGEFQLNIRQTREKKWKMLWRTPVRSCRRKSTLPGGARTDLEDKSDFYEWWLWKLCIVIYVWKMRKTFICWKIHSSCFVYRNDKFSSTKPKSKWTEIFHYLKFLNMRLTIDTFKKHLFYVH